MQDVHSRGSVVKFQTLTLKCDRQQELRYKVTINLCAKWWINWWNCSQ